MSDLLERVILNVLKRVVKKQSFNAKVLEVDQDQDTCTVQPEDGPEIFDVRLKAVEDATGTKAVFYPKVGSQVMCSLIENNPNEAFISKYSEIDEVVLNIDKITINGGNLGGMVKAGELKAQLDKTNQVVQALLSTFTTWVPVPGDGGAALKTAAQGALAGKAVGTFNNLENEKVKH